MSDRSILSCKPICKKSLFSSPGLGEEPTGLVSIQDFISLLCHKIHAYISPTKFEKDNSWASLCTGKAHPSAGLTTGTSCASSQKIFVHASVSEIFFNSTHTHTHTPVKSSRELKFVVHRNITLRSNSKVLWGSSRIKGSREM